MQSMMIVLFSMTLMFSYSQAQNLGNGATCGSNGDCESGKCNSGKCKGS